MTPSLPKSPISISGTKLKKLNPEDIGRSSRLSAKTPVHWGIHYIIQPYKCHFKKPILQIFEHSHHLKQGLDSGTDYVLL